MLLHCEKALFNVLQNNLKSFLYYFFAFSFVRSLISLCAAVFERIQFFITIHVHLFHRRSFCVFVISFVHMNDVQNKRKLWKRVWIRRTASVRLHRQCSNIHSFFLHPLFHLMLGSARLGSPSSIFHVFPCWIQLFPILKFSRSHSLTHSLSYYFDSSFFCLSSPWNAFRCLCYRRDIYLFWFCQCWHYFILCIHRSVCGVCQLIKNGTFFSLLIVTQIISSKGQVSFVVVSFSFAIHSRIICTWIENVFCVVIAAFITRYKS